MLERFEDLLLITPSSFTLQLDR